MNCTISLHGFRNITRKSWRSGTILFIKILISNLYVYRYCLVLNKRFMQLDMTLPFLNCRFDVILTSTFHLYRTVNNIQIRATGPTQVLWHWFVLCSIKGDSVTINNYYIICCCTVVSVYCRKRCRSFLIRSEIYTDVTCCHFGDSVEFVLK